MACFTATIDCTSSQSHQDSLRAVWVFDVPITTPKNMYAQLLPLALPAPPHMAGGSAPTPLMGPMGGSGMPPMPPTF
ncbi:hypothetical protein Tco_1034113 [Tanacetum coccineum]